MNTDYVFDLSNFRDKTSASIPEGRYTVVVEDTELTVATNPNAKTGLLAKGIIVYMRVVGGEYDGSALIDRLWLTDGSAFRLVAFGQAIGMPFKKQAYDFAKMAQHFTGKTLDVDVEDGEPWNGRVKSEIKGFSRPAAGAANAVQKAAPVDLADLTPPTPAAVTAVAESLAAAAATPDVTAAVTAEAAVPEAIDLDDLDLDL